MTETRKTPTPLLICDLDGTVRHGKDELGRFVHGPDDVYVFPQARLQIMRHRQEYRGRVLFVTNQGGIALGKADPEQVLAAIGATIEECGGPTEIAGWHVCPHYPSVTACWCRKPSPGAIYALVADLELRFPHETYPPYMAAMTGDRPEDAECARRAGIPFLPAAEWRESGYHPPGIQGDEAEVMRSYLASLEPQ